MRVVWLSHLFTVNVGVNNIPCNVYSNWDNLVKNGRVYPNGHLQVAKAPSFVIDKKRAIVLRLKSGSTVIQRSGSGIATQNVGIPVIDLVGHQLGYLDDGTPVYMGKPLSDDEIKQIPTIKLNNELIIRQDYGAPLSVGTGYEPPVILIEPVTVVAVILLVALGLVSAVKIAQSIQGMKESERIIAEAQMREHLSDDVLQSTAIEDKWTDGAGNTWIKYRNGELIKIDKNGKATIVVKGTDMNYLANKIMETPYGDDGGNTITDALKWGVILIAVGVGGYLVYRIVKSRYDRQEQLASR